MYRPFHPPSPPTIPSANPIPSITATAPSPSRRSSVSSTSSSSSSSPHDTRWPLPVLVIPRRTNPVLETQIHAFTRLTHWRSRAYRDALNSRFDGPFRRDAAAHFSAGQRESVERLEGLVRNSEREGVGSAVVRCGEVQGWVLVPPGRARPDVQLRQAMVYELKCRRTELEMGFARRVKVVRALEERLGEKFRVEMEGFEFVGFGSGNCRAEDEGDWEVRVIRRKLQEEGERLGLKTLNEELGRLGDWPDGSDAEMDGWVRKPKWTDEERKAMEQCDDEGEWIGESDFGNVEMDSTVGFPEKRHCAVS